MEYLLGIGVLTIIVLLVLNFLRSGRIAKQHEAFDKLLEKMNNAESSAKLVNAETMKAMSMTQNYTNIMENSVATIQKILVETSKLLNTHAETSEKNQLKIEKSTNDLFKMLNDQWIEQINTLQSMLQEIGSNLSSQLNDDMRKMDEKFLLRMKNQAKYFSEVLTRLENRTFNRSVQVFGDSLKAAYGDFAKQNANHYVEVVFSIEKLILDFLEKLYEMEKAAGDAKQKSIFEAMGKERTMLETKLNELKSSQTISSESADEFEVIMASTGIHNEEELEDSVRELDQAELDKLFSENVLEKEGGL